MINARAITKTLGGRWCGTYGLARCPAHGDREPSLKVRDDPRKNDGIDLHCFAGCAWQDVKAELTRQGLIDEWNASAANRREQPAHRRQAEPAHAADHDDDDLKQRIAFAMGTWSASISLPGTLGWRYFIERRGLHIGMLDDLGHCLRFHGGIDAVIALLTDPITNAPIGVHRTFLNPDGTKRERKMLGKAGVVRLTPDEDVTLGLGITEGIEDGLAALLTGWAPIWCATSAGGIERLPVLDGIDCLTVHADFDNRGMDAAQVCVDRWIAAGREAVISFPKDMHNE